MMETMSRAFIACALVVAVAGDARAQPGEPQPPAPVGPPQQQQPYYPPPQQQPYYPPQQQPYYPPQQPIYYPPQPTYAPQPPPPPPPQRESGPRHLVCFAGRPIDCASVLLLEIGYRVDDKQRSVVTADFGLLVHAGYDAFGATIGVISTSDAMEESVPLYAARYRRYLGRWGVATDVSVGYGGGEFAGELALGFADVLAITAGANSIEREDGRGEVLFTSGIRIGSVAIGGLFYAAIYGSAIAATGARR
jgi:hypothetical protein